MSTRLRIETEKPQGRSPSVSRRQYRETLDDRFQINLEAYSQTDKDSRDFIFLQKFILLVSQTTCVGERVLVNTLTTK